jgi:hypothetical protein
VQVGASVSISHQKQLTYIHVTTMFTWWDRPGSLRLNAVKDIFRQVLTDVRALRLRCKRHWRHRICVRGDEASFPFVPSREQFM